MIDTLYRLKSCLLFSGLALMACRAEPTGPPPPPDEAVEAAQESAPVTCPDPSAKRVLVDAAHGGGVWWSPQAGVYDPDEWHQGQALANYIRNSGFQVDEYPRDVAPLDVLMEYPIVIRVGNYASYTPAEIASYRRFLDCDVTLLLLGEYLRPGQRDALAEELGLHFRGIVHDMITVVEPHPLTDRMGRIRYDGGSVLGGFDPDRTHILGRLPDESPVLGVLDHPTATIFFTGDTNGLLPLPQPFIENLVRWMGN